MLQLSYVNYTAGSYLTIEGKMESRFFIIQQGQVRCERRDASPEAGFTTLGPGDFVGVVACMAGVSQIENSVAVTDVVVIAVRRDQYPDLIKQNTPIAMKMIRMFAARMRTVNELLMFSTVSTVAKDTTEQIFKSAQFYDAAGKSDIAIFGYYQYLKTTSSGANAETAKQRFLALKPKSHAVYFESNADMLRKYPQDTMIFSEAQSGAEMFIIQSGQVKIGKIVGGNEVTFAILKKGDMFGEMALLENKPRSASAIANEDCTLMVVNKHTFEQMVTTQPQMIARLTTTLAERLWSMSRQLINVRIEDPIQRMLDMLALQVEKAKLPPHFEQEYKTGLTVEDVADMCGLSEMEKAQYLYTFKQDPHIKIDYQDGTGGKVIVSNCAELLKHAMFARNKFFRENA